jgi:hypothetical protein
MLRRSLRIAITTAAVAGTLGVGVAVAADPPSCPCGNTPRATQNQPGDTATRQQLRKRDGTGPRHAQRSQHGDRRGGGNRGADCPYRS